MDTQMIVAAAKVFSISEQTAALHTSELAQAPIALVNFEGFLKGEDKRKSDARREIIGVYTNDNKALVKHLKSLGGQSVNGLTPWEIIFTYFKTITTLESAMKKEDSMLPVQPTGGEEFTVESTSTEVAATEESAVETSGNVEALAESTQTVASEKEATPMEDATTEISAVPSESNDAGVDAHIASTVEQTRSGVPAAPTDEPATTIGEKIGSTEVTTSTIESSTWETDDTDSIDKKQDTAKCVNNQEVKKMSDLTTIAKGIMDGAEGAESAAQSTALPVQADESINEAMRANIQNTMDARIDFVRKNTISKLISTAMSVKDRLVKTEGITGPLVKASATTKESELTEALVKKLTARLEAHIKAVTGKAMTASEWAGLAPEEQYSNCASAEDVAIAKKCITAIQEAIADPFKEFDLAAPAERNLSYKGLFIGNTPYSPAELATVLYDETVGTLFAAGMINDDGEKTELGKDSKSLIKVSINYQQKKQANQNNAVVTSGTATTTYVPVAALTGKKNLIAQDLVDYLYPQIDKESVKSVQLTVMFGQTPAAYKVFRRDPKTNAIETGVKKVDGVEQSYNKTRTVTLKGSGQAYAVVKELAAAFITAEETTKVACERWNVAAPSVDNNNVFPEDASDTLVFKMLTNTQKNQGVSAQSKLQKDYQNLLKAKADADTADAGEALGV